jgi:hypothetical protein
MRMVETLYYAPAGVDRQIPTLGRQRGLYRAIGCGKADFDSCAYEAESHMLSDRQSLQYCSDAELLGAVRPRLRSMRVTGQTARPEPLSDASYSISLGYLRAAAIVGVVAVHSVLAYCSFVSAPGILLGA